MELPAWTASGRLPWPEPEPDTHDGKTARYYSKVTPEYPFNVQKRKNRCCTFQCGYQGWFEVTRVWYQGGFSWSSETGWMRASSFFRHTREARQKE